jgi:cytoskeletal protein RodZ
MKKGKFLVILLFSSILLVACGDKKETDAGKSNDSVESSSSVSVKDSSTTADSGTNKIEYNQEIADDDTIKATLMSIEHIIDKTYDEEKYVVSFDITNKTDKTMVFQAREVSINDRMVDESLLNMSTEISAGKSATAELTIEDYSGGELPEMAGDFEMILHGFDWDSDETHDVPVKVTLK